MGETGALDSSSKSVYIFTMPGFRGGASQESSRAHLAVQNIRDGTVGMALMCGSAAVGLGRTQAAVPPRRGALVSWSLLLGSVVCQVIVWSLSGRPSLTIFWALVALAPALHLWGLWTSCQQR